MIGRHEPISCWIELLKLPIGVKVPVPASKGISNGRVNRARVIPRLVTDWRSIGIVDIAIPKSCELLIGIPHFFPFGVVAMDHKVAAAVTELKAKRGAYISDFCIAEFAGLLPCGG